MVTKTLVIPAAGSGERMQKEVPKPYLNLKGIPILERTIRRFLELEGLEQITVVTSESYIKLTRDMLSSLLPDTMHGEVVLGGEERQHSISNALSQIIEADLVIVHDAVRPFVKQEHIESCCEAAFEVGAAVLGIPATDTIKYVTEDFYIENTPPRTVMWQTQTPQVFQREVLIKAYKQAEKDDFLGTDDSSLVERMGQKVKMIEGDRMNLKITYPQDFETAKLMIDQNWM